MKYELETTLERNSAIDANLNVLFHRSLATLDELKEKYGYDLSENDWEKICELMESLHESIKENPASQGWFVLRSELIRLIDECERRAIKNVMSERQRQNASGPRIRNAKMHAEIQRIGRSVRQTHSDREVTGIVIQRMADPPSRPTVLKSLRRAGIIK